MLLNILYYSQCFIDSKSICIIILFLSFILILTEGLIYIHTSKINKLKDIGSAIALGAGAKAGADAYDYGKELVKKG